MPNSRSGSLGMRWMRSPISPSSCMTCIKNHQHIQRGKIFFEEKRRKLIRGERKKESSRDLLHKPAYRMSSSGQVTSSAHFGATDSPASGNSSRSIVFSTRFGCKKFGRWSTDVYYFNRSYAQANIMTRRTCAGLNR